MTCRSRACILNFTDYFTHTKESDGGDKSDGDLVVDVGNEDDVLRSGGGGGGLNGSSSAEHHLHAHRVENGPSSAGGGGRSGSGDGGGAGGGRPPSNLSSSSRSTPSSNRQKEDKPGTPGSKPSTPNGNHQQNGKPPTPGSVAAAAAAAVYPPGFIRPPGPGELPLGYPYQNGIPGLPPRAPFVSVIVLLPRLFCCLQISVGFYVLQPHGVVDPLAAMVRLPPGMHNGLATNGSGGKR